MRTDELPAFFDALDAWADEHAVPFETLAYGDHPDQVVDVRRPVGAPPDRLALVVHGGFWRPEYTRRNTTALAVALARNGWASANVEYRRLGQGAWRPMLDDVLAARAMLDGYGCVVATGHSAGGHLALCLAAEEAVDAAVPLGSVCDLAAAARAGIGNDAAQWLIGGDPDEEPAAYDVADPAARLPLGVPQVLVHGVADDRVPLEHALAYVERARAAGDDCRVVEVDAGHFDPIDPRSSVWPDVIGALESAAARASGAGVAA